MNQEITRQLAIMFTDVMGYSCMMKADEHQAISQLEDYRKILGEIIELHEGRVIEFAGDSVFARFHSPVDAVAAGLEIQLALSRYNKEHNRQLRTRIGVHYGEVLEKKGRFYGDNINIAARLEPIADPQGVCISGAVYQKLDAGQRQNCVAYGRPVLKNIGNRLEVYHLFPWPVGSRKRLRLGLRRLTSYLKDHFAISMLMLLAMLVSAVYLSLPLFSESDSAAHYVALGEIRNLSPDTLPEYYTIGIMDEIQTRLKEVPNVYLALAEDEAVADLLLTGSIQQLGDQVRISYQMIEPIKAEEINAASMQGDLGNVLSLQSKLADKIALDLADELALTLNQVVSVKRQIDPEAYQYYLQAREYAKRPDDKQTLNTSVMLYQKAVQIDEGFAAGYAGLCDAYWGTYLLFRDRELVHQAEQACLTAESLDAGLAEVQVALGEIYRGRGRWDESISAYNKAIQIEPRNIGAFVGLAGVYSRIDKPTLAEQTYQRALGLQPGHWETWANYGYYQFDTGQFDKAEKSFRKVVALSPDNVNAYSNLGAALLYQGDFSQAAQVFDKQAALEPSAMLLSNAATMYYYAGDYSHAASLYRKAIEFEPQQYLYWSNLGDALRQLPNQDVEARSVDEYALQLSNKELEVNPEDSAVLLIKSRLLARLGQIGEALVGVNLYQSLELSDPDDQLSLALVFLHTGDREATKNALEQAVQLGYPLVLISAEPEFSSVTEEGWFKTLVDKAQ